MKFEWRETSVINRPAFINCAPFDEKALSRFSIHNKLVTPKTQIDWLDTVLTDTPGWKTIVCGKDIEQCRLFAYVIAAVHAFENSRKCEWVRITGSRPYKNKTDEKIIRQLYVLDHVLTHPTSDDKLSFDPIRMGNIVDLADEHYGKSSVIILCPGLEPEQAVHLLRIKPEFMFYFSRKQQAEL